MQTRRYKSAPRYTSKCLESDLADLNKTLENKGSEWRLLYGSRYNWSAVDLCTVDQLKRHCCQRNLELGTPRECLAAAQRFVLSELSK